MYKKLFEFERWLRENERSEATVKKYVRDARGLLTWCGKIDKERVIEWKEHIREKYSQESVNSMISSANAFLKFVGREDLKLKLLKIQKRSFEAPEKILTKREYERLLEAAERRGKKRLWLLLQTFAATGIRVSEARFITVEALRRGRSEIEMKGKTRVIFIPKKLCRALLRYAKEKKIPSGSVFVTKTGKPLDRTNIWKEMKRVCKYAKVERGKVFPHNLRHLFARAYYETNRDIAKLADILGHSSTDTTRIYLIDTGEAHQRQLEKLKLLKC